MRKLVLWGGAAAAAATMIAASAALAQAGMPKAPAEPPPLRSIAEALSVLMLGGVMGLLGQGIRTIAGFRSSLDKASAQAATQDDVFRAARILVSLFVGFLAGIAATFVIGLPEVAAAATGDVKSLFGIAAAGYAGTDFLEGFFGQYFKGVTAPALGGQAAAGMAPGAVVEPGAIVAPGTVVQPEGSGPAAGSSGAAGPDPAAIASVREDLAEIKSVLFFAPELAGADSPQEVFRAKAPGIMRQLIEDFDFAAFQAAGILGNIGHECLGFTKMQEMRPISGRGGYGWCQWTGPRRRAFEAWARQQGHPIDSDEANYGFLKHELETSERATVPAVKAARTLEEAVRAFQVKFERPGIPHPAPRLIWARRAMEAFDG